MKQFKTTFDKPATFVIPHYADKNSGIKENFLIDTLKGLYAQTDPDWRAIIIDDCSNHESIKDYLNKLKAENYPKIEVIFLEKNIGPGACRNIGIQWAAENNSPFVLFNDADDISHPKRLEVTKKLFLEDRKAGLIYSMFEMIDENNNPIPYEKISSPIRAILEMYKEYRLEGKDTWILMGTETGYFNKTSATSVLTEIALQCPFPAERASEDFHTWMRMSAAGAYYKFTESIPTKYRNLSYMKYQISRTAIGPHEFNLIKARVDEDGFSKAIEIALEKNSIKPEEVPILKAKFYKKLGSTMQIEGEDELVKELLLKEKLYNEQYNNMKIVGV
ncbi:MAG: glycosyltransferase family 2 protein [Bacteroidetes bacterium]|nr:glycosyltransferase family 2 protein [Bacteroidota bacterium]